MGIAGVALVGPAGQGIAAGGTAGQVLSKIDGTDYNTQWTTTNNGDMTKTVYDTGNNGKIDADKIDSSVSAALIGTGTVDNTEFTYLNGVTSSIQTQLDAKGSGTVTSVASGTGLTGGPVTTTGTLSLADTAVTSGSYTHASITVDAQGRLTAASNGTTPVTSVTGTGVISSSGGTTPGISLTGTVPVANGGTGATNLTSGEFLVGNGTGAITTTTSGASLTNLNASNLSSGTVPAAQMPALTGDVTSSAGSATTTVAKIQGRTVANTAPSDGDVLTYNSGSSQWAPAAAAGGGSGYTTYTDSGTGQVDISCGAGEAVLMGGCKADSPNECGVSSSYPTVGVGAPVSGSNTPTGWMCYFGDQFSSSDCGGVAYVVCR